MNNIEQEVIKKEDWKMEMTLLSELPEHRLELTAVTLEDGDSGFLPIPFIFFI